MPATPILDDLDMNFSEILKGRLENVDSLPTGLGLNETGYTVYFRSKVWVWDGYEWNTWDNLPWTDEVNDLDSNNPPQEDTEHNIKSQFLHNKSSNINLSEGFDDNVARTIGTIHFIGANFTIDDWTRITGRRFIYSAKDGSWFNLKNNSPNPLPENCKKIDTRTNTDLFDLVKAEFSFNYLSDTWFLVSFERKQTSSNWFRRFNIPASTIEPISVFTGNIPADSSQGLPYNGFYQVDVYVGVVEYRDTMIQMFTQQPQKLEIYTPGDIWRTIDLSGNYNQGPEAPTNAWYNNSLQGSAIVLVNWPLCGQRDINWRVTLPNGAFNQILGGYIHIKYLGEIEGDVCTS